MIRPLVARISAILTGIEYPVGDPGAAADASNNRRRREGVDRTCLVNTLCEV